VDKPLFGYFKFPLANNIDPLSPLGVSCFSRAVDLIEEADKQWSRFLWENESGERALYVDELAFGRDDEGDPVLPNKRLMRTLETGTTESDMFEDWTPDIREESLLSGLDAILKRIEFNCGLATGTLSNPESIDRTATEIKASKQRSAVTITDTQKAISKLLDQLFYAMDAWATMSKLGGTGKLKKKYGYDDSIVVDKDTQWNQDLGLVGSRTIMSRVEFRQRNFNEDEKTAKKKVEEAMAEANAINQSIFGEEIPSDKKSDITGQEAIL
jgi:A118 family predicted phage portal protein